MTQDSLDPSTLRPEQLTDRSTLAQLLSLLFEPTPALHHLLVPRVLDRINSEGRPGSYDALIDICADVGSSWTWGQKADFVQGHPMIGAPKVSGLSGKEQGGGPVTPKVVLDRLQHLNDLYCIVFPGLRYITFVNGRTRAQIVPDFEDVIGITRSPEPMPEEDGACDPTKPPLESEEVKGLIRSLDSREWKEECERCLGDVWDIGRARLGALGLR